MFGNWTSGLTQGLLSGATKGMSTKAPLSLWQNIQNAVENVSNVASFAVNNTTPIGMAKNIITGIAQATKKADMKSLVASGGNTNINNVKNNTMNEVMRTAGQGVGLYDQASKVFGVPTPDSGNNQSIDPAQEGKNRKTYMDEAYPGLTPWEQAGAGSGYQGIASSLIGADTQLKMQQRELGTRQAMQSRELSNKENVQRIANEGQAVATSASPEQAQSRIDALSGKMTGYDNTLKMMREKLRPEIDNLDAKTRQAIWTGSVKMMEALEKGDINAVKRYSQLIEREFKGLPLQTATAIGLKITSIARNVSGNLR